MATAIVTRLASWLQSARILKYLQIKDLPFDREKLFSMKTDKVLHLMDSQTMLGTLGIYIPPNRPRRYQPYNQNRDTSVHWQQRPFNNSCKRHCSQRCWPPQSQLTASQAPPAKTQFGRFGWGSDRPPPTPSACYTTHPAVWPLIYGHFTKRGHLSPQITGYRR